MCAPKCSNHKHGNVLKRVNVRKLISCKLVVKETKLVKSTAAAGKLFQTFAIRVDNKKSELMLMRRATASV